MIDRKCKSICILLRNQLIRLTQISHNLD